MICGGSNDVNRIKIDQRNSEEFNFSVSIESTTLANIFATKDGIKITTFLTFCQISFSQHIEKELNVT